MHARNILLPVTFLLCIVTTLFWSQGVLAQALQIMPVSLGMPAGMFSNVIMVTNRSPDAQTVQVRAFEWRQDQGHDTLTPTEMLSASPPMTTIAAGATQVFRVLLRQPAERVEATYRLLFDQLPPLNEPAGAVRLTLRLSVPVFAQPVEKVGSGVAWSVVLDGSSAFLHAENHGGQHLRIIHPVLKQEAGARIAVPSAEVSYILAGAAQDWPLAGGHTPAPGSVLHLTASSDQGPVDAMVHVLQR